MNLTSIKLCFYVLKIYFLNMAYAKKPVLTSNIAIRRLHVHIQGAEL